MNGSWPIKQLVEVTDLITCGVAKRPDYVPEGIPFLSAKNVKNGKVVWSDYKYVTQVAHDVLTKNNKPKVGDILYTRVGSFGEAAIIEKQINFSIFVSLTLIKPKREILNTFLKYYLNSKAVKEMAKNSISGSGVGNLNVGTVRKFPVPLPPLPEQKRIVAILDQAFAGIDAAVANTEKNLANARELFESYLNGVFTRKGDGWVEKSVAELADHCLGKMLDKQKNKGNFKPYLRNLNVRWFDFDLTDLLEMRFEASEEDRYSVRKGDVLICEGGYPGRTAIWPHDETINFQKALHRARFKEALHSRWFLFYLFLSDKNGNLKQYFTGAGIQHFTGQSLKRFVLPIAPNAEMERHLDKFESLQVETQRLESLYQQKLTALAELKQSILQKAFAGELTSHPEKTAEEAVA